MDEHMGKCELCQEAIPTTEILDHLRLFHPDEYGDGPQTWPDGSVIILDTTLEPEDFDE